MSIIVTESIAAAARVITRSNTNNDPCAHLAAIDEVWVELGRPGTLEQYKRVLRDCYLDREIVLAKEDMPQTWDPKRLASCAVHCHGCRLVYVDVN